MTSGLVAIAAGEGWTQVGELGLAFVLSSAVGLERELRQKSAGLRTHTLVGVGAALIMLVSKYGFSDVLAPSRVVVDPSRVAAQIVSGIGFIGGGLIFVRRDAVRGLTTAAIVWLTAAIGMACGAGLPVLAVTVTAGHLLVVYGYTALARRLPGSRLVPTFLRLTYQGRKGVLRAALALCTGHGWAVVDLTMDDSRDGPPETATVALQIQGGRRLAELAAELHAVPGMIHVATSQITE